MAHISKHVSQLTCPSQLYKYKCNTCCELPAYTGNLTSIYKEYLCVLLVFYIYKAFFLSVSGIQH